MKILQRFVGRRGENAGIIAPEQGEEIGLLLLDPTIIQIRFFRVFIAVVVVVVAGWRGGDTT